MRTFDNRELQRRVDEVLYYVWDPIGVSDAPCARGEYDSYVPQVLKLVLENDKVKPISEYLADIVTTQMNSTPDRKRCDYAAELLLEHKRAIKEGLA
jgi:hypothetical protein